MGRQGIIVCVALATITACAGAPVEPRVVCAPPPLDAAPDSYRVPRARSVSLGFIGDGPIGLEPSPPYHPPAWERPFPCDWTNTCWKVAPPFGYYPPYAPGVGMYAEPR